MKVVRKKNVKMYEYFHCLAKAVVWQSDFDYEDFEYEGEGIVHILKCSNCGAEIEYRVPVSEEDEGGSNE